MMDNQDDEADEILANEEVENTLNADEKDYEFRQIIDHD